MKIIQYKKKLLRLIKITNCFQIIYNLFQVTDITPSRISSRRYSKKFTSLINPKNFLTKRENRTIKSHSEPINFWKEIQKRAWSDTNGTAKDVTKKGKQWSEFLSQSRVEADKKLYPYIPLPAPQPNFLSSSIQLKPLLIISYRNITKCS